jgi:hypothetical protein
LDLSHRCLNRERYILHIIWFPNEVINKRMAGFTYSAIMVEMRML